MPDLGLIRERARARVAKEFGAAKAPGTEGLKSLGFIPSGISTQSLQLDLAIGRPGIPVGRMTQVIGRDGHGKSTLAMHIAAEAISMGACVAIQDAEGAYEAWRLRKLGADPEGFEPLVPECLEDMHGMTEAFIQETRKADPDIPILVILDTPDGVHAKAAMDAEVGVSLPAIDSRCNGVMVPRIANFAARYKAALVVVQQINPVFASGGWKPAYAEKEYDTKGGESWKFRASLRMQVKRGKTDEAKKQESSAINTKVVNLKNKLAAPFRVAEYQLNYEFGIDKYEDLFEGCKKLKVISGGGGGRYRFKYRKMDESIYRKEFPEIVNQFGGPDKFRRRMLKKAVRMEFIRAYGIWDEQPPAESDAEKEAEA